MKTWNHRCENLKIKSNFINIYLIITIGTLTHVELSFSLNISTQKNESEAIGFWLHRKIIQRLSLDTSSSPLRCVAATAFHRIFSNTGSRIVTPQLRQLENVSTLRLYDSSVPSRHFGCTSHPHSSAVLKTNCAYQPNQLKQREYDKNSHCQS